MKYFGSVAFIVDGVPEGSQKKRTLEIVLLHLRLL